MTARRVAFGAKPTAADWVGEGDGQAPAETSTGAPAPKAALYTARLTIDVTPALRGRIKLAAFRDRWTIGHECSDAAASKTQPGVQAAGGR